MLKNNLQRSRKPYNYNIDDRFLVIMKDSLHGSTRTKNRVHREFMQIMNDTHDYSIVFGYNSKDRLIYRIKLIYKTYTVTYECQDGYIMQTINRASNIWISKFDSHLQTIYRETISRKGKSINHYQYNEKGIMMYEERKEIKHDKLKTHMILKYSDDGETVIDIELLTPHDADN